MYRYVYRFLSLSPSLSLCISLSLSIYIQVAKQVRTLSVRGCDAEKVLVLRNVSSETVLPPNPAPPTTILQKMLECKKRRQKHEKTIPK